MMTLAVILGVHVALMVAMVLLIQYYADVSARHEPSLLLSRKWRQEYHILLGVAVVVPELLAVACVVGACVLVVSGIRKGGRRG